MSISSHITVTSQSETASEHNQFLRACHTDPIIHISADTSFPRVTKLFIAKIVASYNFSNNLIRGNLSLKKKQKGKKKTSSFLTFFYRKHQCSKHKGNVQTSRILIHNSHHSLCYQSCDGISTHCSKVISDICVTGNTGTTSISIQANNASQVHETGRSIRAHHACREYRTLEYFTGCPQVGEGVQGKENEIKQTTDAWGKKREGEDFFFFFFLGKESNKWYLN